VIALGQSQVGGHRQCDLPGDPTLGGGGGHYSFLQVGLS
jgi:hypothetical protein